MVITRKTSNIALLPSRKKQMGVVLVVSLVFLIALTAVAAALMQNTTSDMKMAGASEEKVVATQEAVSAIDEIIFRQVNAGSGANLFESSLSDFPITVTDNLTIMNDDSDTTAVVQLGNNLYKLKTDCPATSAASSVQVFTCTVLRVQVNRQYGRTNTNTVQVNAGIVQQLLN